MTVPGLPGSGWPSFREVTAARIGLARSGASLGTGALLEFRLAHAEARDAVHAGLDEAAFLAGLPAALGAAVVVRSMARDRREYLMRPDLGRRLTEESLAVLTGVAGGAGAGAFDLVIVLGDGLSAQALQRHGAAVLAALMPALAAWRVGAPVLVHGARVAVGDQVARALGARAVLMLLGERPGLSAPDSLGAYVTWAPGKGTTDADRNCVSNIRPAGLGYADAAYRVHHLLERMRAGGVSGVGLKDESDRAGLVKVCETIEVETPLRGRVGTID